MGGIFVVVLLAFRRQRDFGLFLFVVLRLPLVLAIAVFRFRILGLLLNELGCREIESETRRGDAPPFTLFELILDDKIAGRLIGEPVQRSAIGIAAGFPLTW